MDLSDRISCTFSGPVTALGAGQGWKGSAESMLLCPLKGWGGTWCAVGISNNFAVVYFGKEPCPDRSCQPVAKDLNKCCEGTGDMSGCSH